MHPVPPGRCGARDESAKETRHDDSRRATTRACSREAERQASAEQEAANPHLLQKAQLIAFDPLKERSKQRTLKRGRCDGRCRGGRQAARHHDARATPAKAQRPAQFSNGGHGKGCGDHERRSHVGHFAFSRFMIRRCCALHAVVFLAA